MYNLRMTTAYTVCKAPILFLAAFCHRRFQRGSIFFFFHDRRFRLLAYRVAACELHSTSV